MLCSVVLDRRIGHIFVELCTHSLLHQLGTYGGVTEMGICDSTDDADAEFAEFEDGATKAPTTKEEAEAVDLRFAVASGDVHTMRAVIELAPDAVRDWRAPVNLSKQNKSPGTLLHVACLPSIADSREMMVQMLIDGRYVQTLAPIADSSLVPCLY